MSLNIYIYIYSQLVFVRVPSVGLIQLYDFSHSYLVHIISAQELSCCLSGWLVGFTAYQPFAGHLTPN